MRLRTVCFGSLATLLFAAKASAGPVACAETALRSALLAGGDIDLQCAANVTLNVGSALAFSTSVPTVLHGKGVTIHPTSQTFPAFSFPANEIAITLEQVHVDAGAALGLASNHGLVLDRVYFHGMQSGTFASILYCTSAGVTIKGSTFDGGGFGSLFGDACGAIVENSTIAGLVVRNASVFDVRSSTITNTTLVNQAEDTLKANDSIFAGGVVRQQNPGAVFTSTGGNVIRSIGNGVVYSAGPRDQQGTVALSALTAYVPGSVPTRPLAPCSRGINSGAPGAGAGVDQAGNARFQNGARDAGAVESALLPCVTLPPALSVAEDAGPLTVTVTLGGASSLPVTVNLGTADGTATLADDDYTATNVQLTIPAGSTTATTTFTPKADAVYELAETVSLTLTTPSNAAVGAVGTSTLTITNDDAAPVLSVPAALSVTVDEAQTGSISIPVSRTGATKVGSTVAFATSNGTASAGVHYQATTGTSTFAVADALQTIVVPIAAALPSVPSKTFSVTLSAPTDATLGNPTTTVTIDVTPAPVGGAGTGGGAGSGGAGGEAGAGGDAGASGNAGSSGTSGNAGTSGSSGNAGAAGVSGGSGAAGANAGSSGTSGTAGNAGSNATAGSGGVSGVAGASAGGTAGTGNAGQAGASAGGKAGTAGTSGGRAGNASAGTGGRSGGPSIGGGGASGSSTTGVGSGGTSDDDDGGCTIGRSPARTRAPQSLVALLVSAGALIARRARRTKP